MVKSCSTLNPSPNSRTLLDPVYQAGLLFKIQQITVVKPGLAPVFQLAQGKLSHPSFFCP